ncbi:hypothetical protein SLEP1_g3153 [Rubroshorea leprosula]|uniref:Uncharacterized protein n=1 Tax=Rubroshorea leprosula TaxID=152421 RepID=A0AAV5HT46_9ROSI|nr:hypothetical protein SLEP1_g3153 [Rubroshorea leprosula]
MEGGFLDSAIVASVAKAIPRVEVDPVAEVPPTVIGAPVTSSFATTSSFPVGYATVEAIVPSSKSEYSHCPSFSNGVSCNFVFVGWKICFGSLKGDVEAICCVEVSEDVYSQDLILKAMFHLEVVFSNAK